MSYLRLANSNISAFRQMKVGCSDLVRLSWLFVLDQAQPLIYPIADISPDFFELTAADVRAAQTSLSVKAMGYREAPLLTESLRVKRDQERMDKWPVVSH